MMARMAIRPSTTVQGHRQQLKTSQVMIGPQDFEDSLAKVGNYIIRRHMKPGVSEQYLNQQYGARDPYMSYLNQADTGIATLRVSKPGKFKTDFGS